MDRELDRHRVLSIFLLDLVKCRHGELKIMSMLILFDFNATISLSRRDVFSDTLIFKREFCLPNQGFLASVHYRKRVTSERVTHLSIIFHSSGAAFYASGVLHLILYPVANFDATLNHLCYLLFRVHCKKNKVPLPR